MAQAFNLTAQLNLRGPSNVKKIVADIRRDLGTVNANVQFRLDPTAVRNTSALNSALRNLNTTLGSTTTNATNAARAIRSFGSAINSVNIKNVPQQINATVASINKLNNTAAQSGNSLSSATTEMQEFGKQAYLAIRRFAAFTGVTSVIFGVTNAISSGIQAFIEYDKQFVKLQQVTGQSAAGLKTLADTITSLSTQFGVASSDITEVASTLVQAGLTAKDTEKALKALTLSSLAPSFDDMNQTVEGSIALMRQFGISAGDLEKALGSVNSVAAQFAVESSDIITAIQRTGGVFAAASNGVSQGTDALNEFIAVFTSVRATTRESAETIATGLRTIFTRVQRGSTINALKQFGVDLTDAEGKFVGAYKAVELLSSGLSKLDPRDLKFSQIVEELGGFRQIGKVIPLIQQFTTAQEALKVAQRGQGSLALDAAKAQESLANKVTKVKEEFFALFREIGSSKGFQTMVRGALDLTSALIKVADSVKGIIPVLGVLAAFKGASALTQFAAGFIGAARPGKKSSGGIIRKFATGGLVPGSGEGDTVPAMLSAGEFVVRKQAVKAIGAANLHRMNRYAIGGSSKTTTKKKRAEWSPEPADIPSDLPTGRKKNFTHLHSALSINIPPALKALSKKKDQGNLSLLYTNMGLDLPANWNLNWNKSKKDNWGAFSDTLGKYIERNQVFKTLLDNKKKYRFHKRSNSPAYGVLNENWDNIRKKLGQKVKNQSGKFFDTDPEVGTILPRLLTQSVNETLGQKSSKAKQLLKGFNEISAYAAGNTRRAITGPMREVLSRSNRPRSKLQRKSIGGFPLVDDLPNALGSMLPVPGLKQGSPLYEIIKNRGGALDYDRTLQRTLGDKAYSSAKTESQKEAVLMKFFRDPSARLKDAKTARLTQFGKQLQELIKKGVISPRSLSIISKSKRVPGIAEHIHELFGIPVQNMVFTEGGSKTPALEAMRSKGPRINRVSKNLGGLIQRFGIGGTPKSLEEMLPSEILKEADRLGISGAFTTRDILKKRKALNPQESAIKKKLFADIMAARGIEAQQLEKNSALASNRSVAVVGLTGERTSSEIMTAGAKDDSGTSVRGVPVTLQTGALPSAVAKRVQALIRNRIERLVADVGTQIAKAAGTTGTRNRKDIRSISSKDIEDIAGAIFERGLGAANVNYDPSAIAIDFPSGLNPKIASLLGVEPGVMTDATNRATKSAATRKVTEGQFDRGRLEARARFGRSQFANGGAVDTLEKFYKGESLVGGAALSPENKKKMTSEQRKIAASQLKDLRSLRSAAPSQLYSAISRTAFDSMAEQTGFNKDPKNIATLIGKTFKSSNLLSTSKNFAKAKLFLDNAERGEDNWGAMLDISTKKNTKGVDVVQRLSGRKIDKTKQEIDPRTGKMKTYSMKPPESEEEFTLFPGSKFKIESARFNELFGNKNLRMSVQQFAFGGGVDGQANFEDMKKKILEKYPQINFRISKRKSTRGFGYNLMGGLKQEGDNVGNYSDFKQPSNLKDLEAAADDMANNLLYKYGPNIDPSLLKKLQKTKRLAAGGSVPALVSNGEAYIPPDIAKRIGSNTLYKMNRADTNGMTGFSNGGISIFKGPGSGTSDSIPANLPVGSFILREKATKALGLKSGGAVQRFASGGKPEKMAEAVASFDPVTKSAEEAITKLNAGFTKLFNELVKKAEDAIGGPLSTSQRESIAKKAQTNILKDSTSGMAPEQATEVLNRVKAMQASTGISTGPVAFATINKAETGDQKAANMVADAQEKQVAAIVKQIRSIDKNISISDAKAAAERRVADAWGGLYRRTKTAEQSSSLLSRAMDSTRAAMNKAQMAMAKLDQSGFSRGMRGVVGGNVGFYGSMAVGMLAGQGESFFGKKDTNINNASNVAGFEAGASTFATGIATASSLAVIPGVGPFIAAIVLGTTAIKAWVDGVKAATEAALEFALRESNRKAENSSEALGKALDNLSKDVNNVDLQNLVNTKLQENIKDNNEVFNNTFNTVRNQVIDRKKSERTWMEWAGESSVIAPMLGEGDTTFKPESVNSFSLTGKDYETMAKDLAPKYQEANRAAMVNVERALRSGVALSGQEGKDLATAPEYANERMAIVGSDREALEKILPLMAREEELRKSGNEAAANQKLRDREAIISERIRNNASIQAAKKSIELAKAMEEANRAGRQLALSFNQLYDTIGQSINRIQFESKARQQATASSVNALRGNASIEELDSKAINVLENPLAYKNDPKAFRSAADSAANMLGGKQGQMLRGAAIASVELPDKMTNAIAEKLKNNKNLELDGKSGAEAAADIAKETGIQEIKNLNLPPEVTSQLIKQLEANINSSQEQLNKDMQESGGDQQAALDKFIDSIRDTSKSLGEIGARAVAESVALLKERQRAFNQFIENVQEAAKAAKLAENYFKSADKIRYRGSMDLREAQTGVGESFDEAKARFDQEVGALTGGITDPTAIRQSIQNLEKQREQQQEDLKKANDAGDVDEAKKLTTNLTATNTALNNNREALDKLADSAELAQKALDEVKNIKGLQQGREDFVNKLLTSTPEEMENLNNAMVRLQRNLSGGLNNPDNQRDARKAFNETLRRTGSVREASKAGNTVLADQRKETLGLMQDPNFRAMLRLNMKNQQGMSDVDIDQRFRQQEATLMTQMARESGLSGNPMVQQAIAAKMDPNADPAMKRASEQFLQTVGLQAKATEEQGRLELANAQRLLTTATDDLNLSIKNLTDTINASMGLDVGAKGAPAGMVALNYGIPKPMAPMMVSKGALVDFSPRGSDTVPAMLTPGEYVINANATAKHLPLLEAINSNKYSKGEEVSYLADGGSVPKNPREAIRAENRKRFEQRKTMMAQRRSQVQSQKEARLPTVEEKQQRQLEAKNRADWASSMNNPNNAPYPGKGNVDAIRNQMSDFRGRAKAEIDRLIKEEKLSEAEALDRIIASENNKLYTPDLFSPEDNINVNFERHEREGRHTSPYGNKFERSWNTEHNRETARRMLDSNKDGKVDEFEELPNGILSGKDKLDEAWMVEDALGKKYDSTKGEWIGTYVGKDPLTQMTVTPGEATRAWMGGELEDFRKQKWPYLYQKPDIARQQELETKSEELKKRATESDSEYKTIIKKREDEVQSFIGDARSKAAARQKADEDARTRNNPRTGKPFRDAAEEAGYKAGQRRMEAIRQSAGKKPTETAKTTPSAPIPAVIDTKSSAIKATDPVAPTAKPATPTANASNQSVRDQYNSMIKEADAIESKGSRNPLVAASKAGAKRAAADRLLREQSASDNTGTGITPGVKPLQSEQPTASNAAAMAQVQASEAKISEQIKAQAKAQAQQVEKQKQQAAEEEQKRQGQWINSSNWLVSGLGYVGGVGEATGRAAYGAANVAAGVGAAAFGAAIGLGMDTVSGESERTKRLTEQTRVIQEKQAKAGVLGPKGTDQNAALAQAQKSDYKGESAAAAGASVGLQAMAQGGYSLVELGQALAGQGPIQSGEQTALQKGDAERVNIAREGFGETGAFVTEFGQTVGFAASQGAQMAAGAGLSTGTSVLGKAAKGFSMIDNALANPGSIVSGAAKVAGKVDDVVNAGRGARAINSIANPVGSVVSSVAKPIGNFLYDIGKQTGINSALDQAASFANNLDIPFRGRSARGAKGLDAFERSGTMPGGNLKGGLSRARVIMDPDRVSAASNNRTNFVKKQLDKMRQPGAANFSTGKPGEAWTVPPRTGQIDDYTISSQPLSAADAAVQKQVDDILAQNSRNKPKRQATPDVDNAQTKAKQDTEMRAKEKQAAEQKTKADPATLTVDRNAKKAGEGIKPNTSSVDAPAITRTRESLITQLSRKEATIYDIMGVKPGTAISLDDIKSFKGQGSKWLHSDLPINRDLDPGLQTKFNRMLELASDEKALESYNKGLKKGYSHTDLIDTWRGGNTFNVKELSRRRPDLAPSNKTKATIQQKPKTQAASKVTNVTSEALEKARREAEGLRFRDNVSSKEYTRYLQEWDELMDIGVPNDYRTYGGGSGATKNARSVSRKLEEVALSSHEARMASGNSPKISSGVGLSRSHSLYGTNEYINDYVPYTVRESKTFGVVEQKLAGDTNRKMFQVYGDDPSGRRRGTILYSIPLEEAQKLGLIDKLKQKKYTPFAKGGIVYANNGALISAQNQSTDTVPAMLTPGEFVVNRQATQQHMPILNAINSGYYNQGGIVQYLANGGLVSPPKYYAEGGMARGSASSGVSSSIGVDTNGIASAVAGLQKTVNDLMSTIPAMSEVAGSIGSAVGSFVEGGTQVAQNMADTSSRFQTVADNIRDTKVEYNVTGQVNTTVQGKLEAPIDSHQISSLNQFASQAANDRVTSAVSNMNRGVGQLGEGIFGPDISSVMRG
jgi:TP901 family phage tail tape measure protein